MARKKNLIEDLGVDYFHNRYTDKLLVAGGHILSPSRVMDGGRVVACEIVASTTIRDAHRKWAKGEPYTENMPSSYFTSVDVFAYPEMGYRKVKGAAYWISRKINRVFSSGISFDQISVLSTDATSFAETLGAREPVSNREEAFVLSLMFPEYDKPEALESVLKGERLCYVPSRAVLVEPTVRVAADLYDVFVEGMRVGSLTPKGEVSKNTPIKNRAIIKRIMGYD